MFVMEHLLKSVNVRKGDSESLGGHTNVRFFPIPIANRDQARDRERILPGEKQARDRASVLGLAKPSKGQRAHFAWYLWAFVFRLSLVFWKA